MYDSFLTLLELQKRLIRHGHCLSPNLIQMGSTTDVLPTPEVIVTVALYPDPTLKEVYRERYYVCLLDEKEKPLLQYTPGFALPHNLSATAMQEIAHWNFITGPVRWLFTRLWRFGKVLVWPTSDHWRPERAWSLQGVKTDDIPQLDRWLRFAKSQSPLGAITLDLNQMEQCQVLWEIVSLVPLYNCECYISDVDGVEVYRIHHHERIIISITDRWTRIKLLEELSERSDVIGDWSCYS